MLASVEISKNSNMDNRKAYFTNIFSSIHFGWWVFGILALDAFSFHVRFLEVLQVPTFVLLCVIFLALALRNLHFGLLVFFAELFVGSKGYLFAIEIGSFALSIRLAFFLLLMLAALVWMIREKRIAFFHWPLWKPYAVLVAALALAVVVGVVRGNALSTIFFDANGYLYFGLVVAVVQAIQTQKHVRQLLAVMFAAIIALSIKTLVLLFLFAHLDLMPYTVLGIYQWVRDTGVGEITQMPNGFYRVFIQSQIYMLITFFFLLPWYALSKTVRIRKEGGVAKLTYALLTLSTAVIILNASRSFWAATAGALVVLAVWLLLKERIGFGRFFERAAGLLGTVGLAYVLILGVINVPLPGFVFIGDLFSSRASGLKTEAAASTRWNLLPVLAEASAQHPVLGSGLGATVTYISDDPRVREEFPDGRYTTYAFEWGYLDLLLKFGLVGFAALGYFIVSLLKRLYARLKEGGIDHNEALGTLTALIALFGTHMFTPYLNHPLGIGWLLIASVVAVLPSKEKQQ